MEKCQNCDDGMERFPSGATMTCTKCGGTGLREVMKVKRFNMNGNGDLVPRSNGGWIQFNEHRQVVNAERAAREKAEAELAEARGRLAEIDEALDVEEINPCNYNDELVMQMLNGVLEAWRIIGEENYTNPLAERVQGLEARLAAVKIRHDSMWHADHEGIPSTFGESVSAIDRLLTGPEPLAVEHGVWNTRTFFPDGTLMKHIASESKRAVRVVLPANGDTGKKLAMQKQLDEGTDRLAKDLDIYKAPERPCEQRKQEEVPGHGQEGESPTEDGQGLQG